MDNRREFLDFSGTRAGRRAHSGTESCPVEQVRGVTQWPFNAPGSGPATKCGGSYGCTGLAGRQLPLAGVTLLLPSPEFLPAVNYSAEQIGGFLRIVGRAVGFPIVERYSGGAARSGEHGLSVGKAGECRGIKAGEGVKGVALDT